MNVDVNPMPGFGCLPLQPDPVLESFRAVWRDWDPIGVFRIAPDCDVSDEYDDYAQSCMDLVIAGAESAEILNHLRTIVVHTMGLSAACFEGLDPAEFATRLLCLKAISPSTASAP